MNIDPEMLKALEGSPFPVLELAKLMDALMIEFSALEGPERLRRGAHFIAAMGAIKDLSAAWTEIVQTRSGPNLIH